MSKEALGNHSFEEFFLIFFHEESFCSLMSFLMTTGGTKKFSTGWWVLQQAGNSIVPIQIVYA